MRNVLKEEYLSWLDNDVTKRFMAEIKSSLQDAYEERVTGTHEQMIRIAHERNAQMDIFNNILDWKPSELEEKL
jgi:hypothetical protein